MKDAQEMLLKGRVMILSDDINFRCLFSLIATLQYMNSMFHFTTQYNNSLLSQKGQKYEISEEDVNEYEKIMRLTIKSWQKADESHFTCISTNSLGKADGKIQAYSKFHFQMPILSIIQ